MLHANMQLMNSISEIDAQIAALTTEWRQLNEKLADATESMYGKSPAEKKSFDENFSITFRSECDRIDEIEATVKSLRSEQARLDHAHYTSL